MNSLIKLRALRVNVHKYMDTSRPPHMACKSAQYGKMSQVYADCRNMYTALLINSLDVLLIYFSASIYPITVHIDRFTEMSDLICIFLPTNCALHKTLLS